MELRPGAPFGQRYRVEELLGRGGMGEVWRCHDLERAVDVAIKIVRHERHHDHRRRLFHDEVMATAYLDHPSIVRVLDVVQVDDDLALVMELRRGVPLRRVGRIPFAIAAELLGQVLDALAYAHARNVLHLDVKPANVVVDLAHRRATLLDFGVARVWRAEAEEDPERGRRLQGTPAYMAPEQLAQAPGSLGPWTDLYAFGVMTYELLSGFKPFAGQDAMVRTYQSAPRLNTGAMGLDPRLGDLLMSLITPRLEDRPTHAADVQFALASMERRGDVRGVARDDDPTDPTRSAPTTETAPASVEPRSTADRVLEPVPLSQLRRRHVSAPQMEAIRPVAPGTDALFGLREAPVLGRPAVRMRLWKTVQAARHEDAPTVSLLVGAPGHGKSRLARDVMERAHQTGLAHTAWTSWSEGGAGNEGLRGLLESATGSAGVIGDELAGHLERWTRRFPGDADARFCNDARLFLDPQGRSTEADLPRRVTAEALRRLSIARGVVVVLDDVQWGVSAAVALVNQIRELGGAIAVVATARAVVPSLSADVVDALEALDVETIRAYVRGQLDVDDALLALIVAASEGNALRASETLRDLVESGLLRRVGLRYALREGAPADAVSGDLATLWNRRLSRAGVGVEEIAALAIVRPRVSDQLRERLETLAGAAVEDAIRAAMRAGLLRRRQGALHWTHLMLRRHVVDQLGDAVRRRLHAQAAEVLSLVVGQEDVQAERAAHLWAAGQTEAACETMLEAVGFSLQAADRSARRARAEQLLAWAQTPATTPYRARALAELAHLEALARRTEAAEAVLADAKSLAPGASRHAAWLAFREAQVLTALGKAEPAREANARAARFARHHEQPEVLVQALGLSAVDAYRRNDPDRARSLFEEVIDAAAALGDAVTEAKARFYLANIAPTDSLDMFERAIASAQRAGAVSVELSARQVYADALFQTGRRLEAEREMEAVAAQAKHRRMRQLSSMVAIQLACWRLWDDDVAGAAEHCLRARQQGAGEGSVLERSMVAAIEAAVAGARDDREAAERALARLAAERGELDEPDLHKVLAWAANHASPSLAAAFAALV